MKKTLHGIMAGLLLGAAGLVAAEALKVGDKAPEFSAKDQDGKEWNLKDLEGKKIVLLYFYPKDDTPGCTAEACGLRDRMSDLEKGNVQVLGVSFDDATSHKAFRAKYKINFPLLVDKSGELADLYHARRGPNVPMSRRVSFLIGTDGSIKHITDNPSAQVHLSEMKSEIDKLTAK